MTGKLPQRTPAAANPGPSSCAAQRPAPLCRLDFDYTLPPELIAQTPLPQRSSSRLLRLEAGSGRLSDHALSGLPGLLAPGDLLVFNDTRVLPARLRARRVSGGRVELLLERALAGCRALVQVRSSHALHAQEPLYSAGGVVRVIAARAPFWEVEWPAPTHEFLERYGEVPLPPYIGRAAAAADRERYQSLFARVPGAVAAPTASLHFDQPLLEALDARAIARTCITLHVGAGTFQPVRTEDLDAHVMHHERYEVPADAVDAIARARARGGRIVAVGTTVARALEAAAGSGAFPGVLRPGAAETALFIRPGYRFRVIDGLLTNFHLPQSTLLMLVAALAGREPVLKAYAHAVAARYRFFSYGDAMLIDAPRRGGALTPAAPAVPARA